MNILKTALLMFVMTALFVFFGYALGGQQGMILAVGFAMLMNVGSYWFSDRIVLAMHQGREVTRAEAPRLYGIVEKLAAKAQLPMPRVYILPSASPNAFATGRNPEHAAVAATESLLEMLDDRQVEAVMAHELAHIKHRDMLIGTIVGTMAGALSMLASLAKWGAIFGGVGSRDNDDNGGAIGLLVMAIIVPIIAVLVQMAISRSREYHADEEAGRLTGDPMALATALQRIERGLSVRPMAEAGPATAHLFIASPLKGRSIFSLLSTHPAMEDRIAKLTELAAELGVYRG